MSQSLGTDHSRRPSLHSHRLILYLSLSLAVRLCACFSDQRNESLWQNINSFIKSTVVTASSQIHAADQLLMKSQVTLQAASRAIVQANDTSESVLNKCRDILSYEYMPEITIPQKDCIELEQ